MATTTPECVDEEINKQGLVSLSDFRAQKNSFLPVSRLPPENLADVFIRVRDYQESYGNPSYRVPHWVNASYVCRYWRNVAMDCPTLWAHLFTVSLRWTEELLARSKQASLKIRIKYAYDRTSSWWSRLLEMVLMHAERIQELRLAIPDMTLLPTGFSLYAPRLQILELFSSSHSEPTFTIMNGDTLPLRILRLASVELPWYSFNLSRVTTLFLSLALPSQLNMMEFLTTLSRMQALTILHLEYSLPSDCGLLSDGAFNISSKVSLPCLACLLVQATFSEVVTLLSCINIPLETRLWIGIMAEDGAYLDDYVQILPVLAQRFNHSEDLSSSSATIRSLAFCFDQLFSTLAINTSERDDYDPKTSEVYLPDDCNIPLTIRLTLIEQPVVIEDHIMSNICCRIPSTHIQSLHIVNPSSSLDFWKKALDHLDGLRRLKLSDGLMPKCLASLLALTAEGRAEDQHDPRVRHTFVPALEELELHLMTFRSKSRPSGKIISEKALLGALSTRKVLRLTMTQCNPRLT